MSWCGNRSWVIVWFCLAAAAGGQDAAPPSPAARKPTPLGVRQARVERMMDEVEHRFKELSQSLQQAEPKRAERLIKTLQQAKQLLIQQRMKEITRMLDQQQLEPASEQQKLILADIRKLIQLLLDEQNQDALDQYERLRQWREALKRILAEEHGHKRASEKVANKEGALADLDAQIRAVEKLIQQQAQVNQAMAEARKEGVHACSRVADQQHELRKPTEAIADAIARGAGPTGSPGGSEGGDQGSGQREPGAAEPGEQPLRWAAGHQQAAENHLQSGKAGGAQADGKAALEDLKAARAELQKERRRLASLPPQALDEMAKGQDQTLGRTARLDQQMRNAAQSGGSSGSSGGSGGQGGGQSPGQRSIEQSQQAMRRASADLRQQDPQRALRQQEEAIRQLERALHEIEERLAQLREETQQERLARLEARFTEMLARQQAATQKTETLDRKRSGRTKLPRADRLAVARLAREEHQLAELAQQALDILIDDGTSVVFLRIVEDLRDDLTRVAELLEARRTGGYTQHLQQEIETTLEELIEALKRVQRQGGGGGGGGGGGAGELPLLPNSAELKLLRAAQLRVNRRTKAFDENRPEGALDAWMKKEIDEIAARQLEIAAMTEQLIQRSQLVPLP